MQETIPDTDTESTELPQMDTLKHTKTWACMWDRTSTSMTCSSHEKASHFCIDISVYCKIYNLKRGSACQLLGKLRFRDPDQYVELPMSESCRQGSGS